MRSKIFFVFLFLSFSFVARSQYLQPGFDKEEYIETLKINQKVHIAVEKWMDSSAVPAPAIYRFVSRSPRVGFDNISDLWKHPSKPVALIAVQGTIATNASFLANLYAAMVPAKGKLELSKEYTFDYTLSEHPSAAVHVGWLISLAYLAPHIVNQIDSSYKAGTKEFILTGHSQGGGITFLLNAYLKNLQRKGKLPADILFKTYCSAGPKPGNLFFAHDFEHMNSGGWAYNVINTADWVPDVPFTVQTVEDFTAVNPFRGAKAAIKKQKFPANIALKHVYNRLDKPSRKAQKNYQKYLGKMVSKIVKKNFTEFNAPKYFDSNYYVRTGTTIGLYADEEYFKLYSNAPSNPNIWQHHFPSQYLYLVGRMK